MPSEGATIALLVLSLSTAHVALLAWSALVPWESSAQGEEDVDGWAREAWQETVKFVSRWSEAIAAGGGRAVAFWK